MPPAAANYSPFEKQLWEAMSPCNDCLPYHNASNNHETGAALEKGLLDPPGQDLAGASAVYRMMYSRDWAQTGSKDGHSDVSFSACTS